jgi:hypothetical protein
LGEVRESAVAIEKNIFAIIKTNGIVVIPYWNSNIHAVFEYGLP